MQCTSWYLALSPRLFFCLFFTFFFWVCFHSVLPFPGSLATHALSSEMRHTGNLQADNGRQLLSLHKSFMSWISCTSLCSLPPTHASLIASWSRHSNTPRGELRRGKDGEGETKHDRGFVWQIYDCFLQSSPTYIVSVCRQPSHQILQC